MKGKFKTLDDLIAIEIEKGKMIVEKARRIAESLKPSK